MNPPPPATLSPRARILLATPAVYLLWAMGWFGIMTFVNVYYTNELGHSVEAWTTMMLWFNGSMVAWQLSITELSARFGRLRTLGACAIAGSLGYAGIPLVSEAAFAAWYMPLLLVTISSMPAAAVGVWLPMVAEAGGAEAGKLLAWVQGVNVVACVAIFSAASWGIYAYGYDMAFYAIGGSCAAATAIFILLLRPLPASGEAPPISLPRIGWQNLRKLLTPGVLLILACGFLAEPFNYQTNNQLWPNLMQNVFKWDEHLTNLAVTFARVPGMLALLLIGIWVDRMNAMRLYSVMVIVTATMTFAGGATDSTALALVAYIGFHTFQCACWGCDVASIDRAAGPGLRDAAICLAGAVMTVSALGVNALHAWMAAGGYDLPAIFRVTGCVALALGCVLCVGSFLTRAGERPAGGT